jgi:arylsulfatase A-like enzyme
MVEHNQVEHAIHSYLACGSFVDAQVGRVLDALEKSPNADNTIVVLWSDHGFHLGTKDRWGKRSLWEDATRVPLIFAGPGVPQDNVFGIEAAGLIDIYPTMIELCNLAPRDGLEGKSLKPLFDGEAGPGTETPWVNPTITTFGQNNHAIVFNSSRRYIRYADGSEEYYGGCPDRYEHRNWFYGESAEAAEVRVAWRRQFLPEINVPMAPGSAHADARPGSAADIDGPRQP